MGLMDWEFTRDILDSDVQMACQVNGFNYDLTERVLACCNGQLREWLDKAPVVYGRRQCGEEIWTWDDQPSEGDDTHTARLVEIKELK